MIRRLLLVLALALGVVTAGATSAGAATGVNASNGNIACVYNLQPLNIGLCLGI